MKSQLIEKRNRWVGYVYDVEPAVEQFKRGLAKNWGSEEVSISRDKK
jgi:hypothetical protein